MAATKTEVVVLNFRRQWKGRTQSAERRRHRRFDTTALSARVAMVGVGEAGLELHGCALSDLSYGGMKFTTEAELAAEREYRFVLDLGAPFSELVLVKARVVWLAAGPGRNLLAGARFLESSKGWLGSEEDRLE